MTELLLLRRLTKTPTVGAGALSFTEHLSVPAPVIEEFAQLSPDREALEEPLPCSLT